MRKNRRRAKSEIDLIGFLDILSVVIVIVLLVISLLALSIGVQVSTQDPSDPPAHSESKEPSVNPPQAALVEMKTVDGQNITAATAFLLCRGQLIHQFNPSSGEKTATWNLGAESPYEIARRIGAPNVYLAVAGSCFPSLESLVDAFRSSGVQLGYEPTTEDAVLPWQ